MCKVSPYSVAEFAQQSYSYLTFVIMKYSSVDDNVEAALNKAGKKPPFRVILDLCPLQFAKFTADHNYGLLLIYTYMPCNFLQQIC